MRMMHKLHKFIIFLGIGMGVTLFSLLLFAVLPSIIQNAGSDWEQIVNSGYQSDEKLLAIFESHPAYIAMYETYPDAKQELNSRGRGNGILQVGIMNFETNNQLVLEMYHDKRNDSINVNARCHTMNDERNLYADGLFTEDFIKNTNCLDIIGEITDTEVTMHSSGDVVTLEMQPLR